VPATGAAAPILARLHTMWTDTRLIALWSVTMGEASQPVLGFDPSVPNSARMYDYWLGGKDNFAVDREAAERQTRAIPELPWLARQNRDFLQRAVRFCAGEGVTQFLDIGSGLPTNQNVHEVAQLGNADSRVVYVDIDPVVVVHARALLSGSQTAAMRGDVCHPDDILSAPEVRRLIDLTQPVAVLALAILHFIPDEADPAGCVARLRNAMAPGSYLIISHADVSPAHVVGTRRLSHTARELQDANKALAAVPARTRDEIAGFFGDLTLVEPGLTDIWAWRPDDVTFTMTSGFMRILGGVARKD
jgi:S-adenosyl methyltransferase